MAKIKSNIDVYIDIISAIAAKSATKIEGVSLLSEGSKRKNRVLNDVQAFIVNELVNVDVFVNILSGFNIPDVVCALQERIKLDIESETCYKVAQINVSVVGIIVEEGPAAEPIRHVFLDDEDENEPSGVDYSENDGEDNVVSVEDPENDKIDK
jgi:Uncharacterized protein conserved in bacteria